MQSFGEGNEENLSIGFLYGAPENHVKGHPNSGCQGERY